MTFDKVLPQMRRGERDAKRESWPKKFFIRVTFDDESIYLFDGMRDRIYTASPADVLADDWELI